MELKVLCDCGQKFKFDVEPVNGQMPFTINCPACNADATATANTMLAEQIPTTATTTTTETTPAPAPIAPVPGGLRINRHVPEPSVTPPPLAVASADFTPPPISGAVPVSAKKMRTDEFSLVRGIIGAVVGGIVGCGLMLAFVIAAHFRFPLMGVAVGATAGYPARWLARGTDTTLGIITAIIAGGLVTGTFVLMYGEFAAFNFISIIICAVVAYRITSG